MAAASDGNHRNPARRRSGLAGQGPRRGLGLPRVRFEAVRRSEDAPAMAGGGGAAVRPPRPNCQRPGGSASQGRCTGPSVDGRGDIGATETRRGGVERRAWRRRGLGIGGAELRPGCAGLVVVNRREGTGRGDQRTSSSWRNQLARRQGDTRRGRATRGAAGRVSPCSAARGAWPVGPSPWARRTALEPSESTKPAWSTSESPRHPYAGETRGSNVAGAVQTRV
jgi:hypothetical protein